jgi:hypothetical protein
MAPNLSKSQFMVGRWWMKTLEPSQVTWDEWIKRGVFFWSFQQDFPKNIVFFSGTKYSKKPLKLGGPFPENHINKQVLIYLNPSLFGA